MCRLICAFVVRIWQKQVFSRRGSFLWPSSPYHWFKWGNCQLLAKVCALSLGSLLYIVGDLSLHMNSVSRLTDWLNMTLIVLTVKWTTSWEPVYAICDHPRSLISAFVVHCLDRIIPLVSISKLSSLYLASVAVQAGLSLPWPQTPKTGFLVTWLKL